MDVATYGENHISGQITKMPGDYIDGKIQSQIDTRIDPATSNQQPFPSGDTPAATAERNAILKDIGRNMHPPLTADQYAKARTGMTEAEYNAADSTQKAKADAKAEKWDKDIGKGPKDAAETLRQAYLDNLGINEFLKDPVGRGTLKINLDPFDATGKNTMVFEAPKVPVDKTSPEYQANSFTEGGKVKNVYTPGELPTTAEGHKSLYDNLQKRIQTLRNNPPSADKPIGDVTTYTEQIKALEATVAVVEASYAAQEVSRLLTPRVAGTESAVKSAETMAETGKFLDSHANILRTMQELESDGSTLQIQAQAGRILGILDRTRVATELGIREIQDAVKTLQRMQQGVTELKAREMFRPAA